MKSGISLAAISALFALGSGAHAQTTVSYFNFNALTNASTVNVSTIAPNVGNGTLSTTFNTMGVTAFGGTTINAQGADVAGQALGLTGGSSGSGTPNNNAYLQLNINTLSFRDLTFSFATQKTTTGFNSNQLSYSTDGTNFTNFGTVYNPPTAFALQSFDLTSVSALNNKPSVFLRVTFNGATSGAGNNRIDNLKLTAAVPAPSSLAILALGALPGIGLLVRRKRCK